MPNFYDHPETKEFGKIKITPKPWWRRFKTGSYSILPYFTMDMIEFIVDVDRIPDPINASHIYTIVERVGDNTYRNIGNLNEKKIVVRGRADYSGDTKFFVGRKDLPIDSVEQRIGIILFSDHVLPMNHYVLGCAGWAVASILGCIAAIVAGVVLGFFQITPERIIWWPW
jgi:hypothetical protein